MSRVEIIVPGKPDHLRRHRSRIVKKKNAPFVTDGQGRKCYALDDLFVATYPDPKNDFGRIQEAAARAMEIQRVGRLRGPLRARIVCRFAVPQSDMRKTMDVPAEWRIATPDVDNHLKLPFDALNGMVYDDDALFCDARIVKYRAAQGVEAATSIVFEEIEEPPCK